MNFALVTDRTKAYTWIQYFVQNDLTSNCSRVMCEERAKNMDATYFIKHNCLVTPLHIYCAISEGIMVLVECSFHALLP